MDCAVTQMANSGMSSEIEKIRFGTVRHSLNHGNRSVEGEFDS